MPRTIALPHLGRRRVALAVALALLVLLLVSFGERLKPRIWTLNEMLRSDPVLAVYPYDTRVVSFLNGIVTLTRPYTDYSGPQAFLVHLDPALAGLAPDHPAMRSAQEALQQHEQRAIALLLEQPGIESVSWWLDEAWYKKNNVAMPAATPPPPSQ